jgi:hypothetical protein
MYHVEHGALVKFSECREQTWHYVTLSNKDIIAWSVEVSAILPLVLSEQHESSLGMIDLC